MKYKIGRWYLRLYIEGTQHNLPLLGSWDNRTNPLNPFPFGGKDNYWGDETPPNEAQF